MTVTAFTNVGTAVVTAQFTRTGAVQGFFVGWGTGTTTPAVTDTALQTEVAPTTSGGRPSATVSQITTSITNDTTQWQGIVTATVQEPITEAGVLTLAAGGSLVLHSVFNVMNVDPGDSLEFTWALQQVAGL